MIKKNGIGMVEVVLSLYPNAAFSTKGAGTKDESQELMIWETENISRPTEAELETEQLRLLAEYETMTYSRNRKLEYDALNQFELISDDDANGTTTHKDSIAAIKTKWPKDNSGPV